MSGSNALGYKSDSESLLRLLGKLALCVQEEKEPGDSDWPSSWEYNRIIHLIKELDPLPNRERDWPLWNQALAKLDSDGPRGLRNNVRNRIEEFVRYAGRKPIGIVVPPITAQYLSELRKRQLDFHPDPSVVPIFKEINKIVRGEREIDSSHLASFLSSTSTRFQKSWERAEKTLPPKARENAAMRVFAGYAAVLDIDFQNWEFLRNFRWIEDLGDFVSELANQEFDEIAKRLKPLCISAETFSELRKRRRREKNRKSQARRRKRNNPDP